MTHTSATTPPSPRYERMATVVSHEHIVGSEYEIVFHCPEIADAARPGQFLALLFGDNYAPLIRRPFSIYRADREAGTCSVLYVARGSFTSGLSQKRVGDRVSLLGPLGQPFTWPESPDTQHLLIAGGIGATPLAFLARELCGSLAASGTDTWNITVILGARTEELLVGLTEFGGLPLHLYTVTDDGSHGKRTLAPALLTELLDERTLDSQALRLYACGPTPMLRAVSEIAVSRSLACQISVETAMPCGIGTCQGCAIPVQDAEAPSGFHYARACWDGPVFEAKTLLWK